MGVKRVSQNCMRRPRCQGDSLSAAARTASANSERPRGNVVMMHWPWRRADIGPGLFTCGVTAHEMTLKAAYFLLVGLTETDQITWQGHLQPAINRGQGMGIVWPKPGAGHNVRAGQSCSWRNALYNRPRPMRQNSASTFRDKVSASASFGERLSATAGISPILTR